MSMKPANGQTQGQTPTQGQTAQQPWTNWSTNGHNFSGGGAGLLQLIAAKLGGQAINQGGAGAQPQAAPAAIMPWMSPQVLQGYRPTMPPNFQPYAGPVGGMGAATGAFPFGVSPMSRQMGGM